MQAERNMFREITCIITDINADQIIYIVRNRPDITAIAPVLTVSDIIILTTITDTEGEK